MPTAEIVTTMSRAGRALGTLPLEELPDIATARIHIGSVPKVEMHLGPGEHEIARVLAWAGCLDERTALVRFQRDSMRVETSGFVGPVPVSVWNRVRGTQAVEDMRQAIGIPGPRWTAHVSLVDLWHLAGHHLNGKDA